MCQILFKQSSGIQTLAFTFVLHIHAQCRTGRDLQPHRTYHGKCVATGQHVSADCTPRHWRGRTWRWGQVWIIPPPFYSAPSSSFSISWCLSKSSTSLVGRFLESRVLQRLDKHSVKTYLSKLKCASLHH